MRFLRFLISAALPIHLAAAVVSPEIPIAAPRVAAPRAMYEGAASATDGAHVLIAWAGDGGLMATIADRDGRVPAVPQAPIIASSDFLAFSAISAVWTGAAYLVTYRRNDPAPAYTFEAVTLARDGTVLTGPTVVATNASPGPIAASGHGAFAVYYSSIAERVDVKGAIFSDTGTVVATGITLPVQSGDPLDSFGVASDRDGYAFVWRTSDYVPLAGNAVHAQSPVPPLQERFDTFHLQRLNSEGLASGAPIKIDRLEQTNYGFDVAFGAGKYAVVTTEDHFTGFGTGGQRRAARFIVDAGTGAVTALPKIDDVMLNAVVWNGSAFLAYGSTNVPASDIVTYRFSESLNDPPSLAGLRHRVYVAFVRLLPIDGRIFAAWNELTAINGVILTADASAVVTAPVMLSVSWSRQITPAIASAGNESLVVWREETSGVEGEGLWGRRINSSGAALDEEPFLIVAGALYEAPVVTFTGQVFLVVWSTDNGGGDINVRTVHLDGSLGPVVHLGGGYGISVASAATATLVAFTTGRIVGYRFTPSGQQVDTQPIAIGEGWAPQVASNGTDFLVAWNVGSDYWQFPPPDMINVMGSRVTASGSADATAISIATGPPDQKLAGIGSDGRDYSIFYWYSNWSQGFVGLAAKRVLREGQLAGSTAEDIGSSVIDLNAAQSTVVLPAVSVARNGNGYWVASTVSRNAMTSVLLTHIADDGSSQEVQTLLSVPGYDSRVSASLAKNGGSPLQVVYAKPIADGVYAGTTRVMDRWSAEPTPRRRSVLH